MWSRHNPLLPVHEPGTCTNFPVDQTFSVDEGRKCGVGRCGYWKGRQPLRSVKEWYLNTTLVDVCAYPVVIQCSSGTFSNFCQGQARRKPTRRLTVDLSEVSHRELSTLIFTHDNYRPMSLLRNPEYVLCLFWIDKSRLFWKKKTIIITDKATDVALLSHYKRVCSR